MCKHKHVYPTIIYIHSPCLSIVVRLIVYVYTHTHIADAAHTYVRFGRTTFLFCHFTAPIVDHASAGESSRVGASTTWLPNQIAQINASRTTESTQIRRANFFHRSRSRHLHRLGRTSFPQHIKYPHRVFVNSIFFFAIVYLLFVLCVNEWVFLYESEWMETITGGSDQKTRGRRQSRQIDRVIAHI